MSSQPVVLVVDDQAGNREALRALLAADDLKVAACESGLAALEAAAAAPPDLVLLDVMMPGIDGFETCRRLREDPRLAEVPVILVTALDDRESRIAGFEAGADDFVTKPYDRLELRTRVRGLLRLNRYRLLVEERARTERQQAALAQTEKLAAMGSLLAGVAHELNNPLTVVTGNAALLLQRPLGEKDAERARRILSAGERCARIVKNFLALARRRPPERFAVKLNDVVSEALELLAHPLRAHDVAVELDLAPDLPPVWADGHRLHQVVVNLVANAEQALRGVAHARALKLTTRSADGRAWVEVADNGPGVPAAVKERIFEPFFTTKPPGEGTGLGLSLCRNVAAEHAGALEVRDTPGGGATFRLEIPVGSIPAAERPASEREIPTAGRRILVVDDDEALADVLADALRMDGHEVDTALGGKAALQRLEGTQPELVVSDVRMAGLDGPGLHAEVARRWPALERRFVFMTGDTLGADTRGFLERVDLPVLEKPFDLAGVRRTVARALEGASAPGRA